MSTGNVMKTRRPDPAEVEYKQMRFLIMDRPTDATIDRFIEVRLKSPYFKVLSLAISLTLLHSEQPKLQKHQGGPIITVNKQTKSSFDGWIDGWTTRNSIALSTIFLLYQNNGRVMKDCVYCAMEPCL